MSQYGGKDSKRHFTIVIRGKEHGLYVSSTPSSAARKAVTKLCAANKSKKVEFQIREITQGSKKKTYGPYSGYIEKLKEPIELKGRVIKYKPVAKIAGKKSEMKGGVSEFNTGNNGKLTSDAEVKMFENFKVKDQLNPAPYHYKTRTFHHKTFYFGVEYLLNINDLKYYPFSIHSINNQHFIRFLFDISNNIERTLIYWGEERKIGLFKSRNYKIIELEVNILGEIIVKFKNILLNINSLNSIDQGIIEFKEFVENFLSSLILINTSINKIEFVDKKSINKIKDILEEKIEDLIYIANLRIMQQSSPEYIAKKNEEKLLKKIKDEFPVKINQIINSNDTNEETKNLLQKIINLTEKEWYNHYSDQRKKCDEAYTFLENEYIKKKKSSPEKDGIELIKELLQDQHSEIIQKHFINTRRSHYGEESD
jgi:hypothetical protein